MRNGTFATLVVIALCVCFGGCALKTWGTDATVAVTVDSKERVADGDSSKYLVWSREGEVFEDTDSILRGKTRSSDLYGSLKVGKRYRCTVNGWRLGITSSYRNILDCEPVG